MALFDQFHEFASKKHEKNKMIPNGIYTKLTQEFSNQGTLLSGGELQKLAISRVYARECGIIILDEPSSSLDPIAENDMFNAMLNLAKNKTVILISHRLANVKNADRIYLLENGEIIEQGSHQELMLLGKQYAKMYNMQATRYTDDDISSIVDIKSASECIV
jgi:ATP-binding cassette subfamily B protein